MNLDDRETKLPMIIKRGTKKKVNGDYPFKTITNTKKDKVLHKNMERVSKMSFWINVVAYIT